MSPVARAGKRGRSGTYDSAKWSNIATDRETTWHRAELLQNAEDEILLCFFLAENLGLS